ncbi:MAG: hypothetical protein O9345_09705 [Burkholderiaceae bacterium]|nr:hypothetical protein [Burkholderiaceae bacterium]
MLLAEPLVEAPSQARALGREREIDVTGESPWEVLPVLGDAQRLRPLPMVLLDNAVRYVRPGGCVTTRVRRVAGPAGEHARCERDVVDEGIGSSRDELPPGVRAHVPRRAGAAPPGRRHRARPVDRGGARTRARRRDPAASSMNFAASVVAALAALLVGGRRDRDRCVAPGLLGGQQLGLGEGGVDERRALGGGMGAVGGGREDEGEPGRASRGAPSGVRGMESPLEPHRSNQP